MSAFIVSHKHINTLVSVLCTPRDPARVLLADGTYLDLSETADQERAANILYNENVRSINARYPDTLGHIERAPGNSDELAAGFHFQRYFELPSAVTLLKACQCYDYQACETDDYETTDAKRIIEAIKAREITRLVGYENAPWELK